MKTNPLLLTAAVAYGIPAIALIFAPAETIAAFGGSDVPAVLWLGQLLGGALFGLAFANWMSRYSVVGGVLGRPILMTNLAFAMPAFFASVTTWRRQPSTPLLAATLVLGTIMAAFALKLFVAPRVNPPVS